MTNAMKASIKFRDDQKPLLRAKVPISILGLPFLSGVSAGESKELRLDLATAFDSGPSVRVSYRPNDPATPFSLVVKTGVGSFGSPIGVPFGMAAEFNLVGPAAIGAGPRFSILIKPRFGDFVLKKSVQSNSVESVVKKIVIDNEKNVQEPSVVNGKSAAAIGFYPFESVNGFTTDVAKSTNGLLSGMEMNARSVLPFFNRASVKFRWGLRVPPELNSGVSISKLPLLVMNKLSIEHVVGSADKADQKSKSSSKSGESIEHPGVKSEYDALKAESGLLRRAVEDLRAELITLRSNGVGRGFDSVTRNGAAQIAAVDKRDNKSNGKLPDGSWLSNLEEAKKPATKASDKK